MKKWLAIVAIVGALAVPAMAADQGAAAILSAVMPGTGEWYNNNWKGAFPWGECILGHICPCVQLTSIMDAANGNTDLNLRIDFWSAPTR
jgi:hypothetical protein